MRDRRVDGVEAGAAFLEHGIAGIERSLEVDAVGALVFGGHRGAVDHAGTAVNGDRNHRGISVGSSRRHRKRQAGEQGGKPGGTHPRYYP